MNLILRVLSTWFYNYRKIVLAVIFYSIGITAQAHFCSELNLVFGSGKNVSLSFPIPKAAEIFDLQFSQPGAELIEEMKQSNHNGFQIVPLLNAGKALSNVIVTQNVKTVFYPFASYDATTPMSLFPNASTIIAVDNAPFVRDLTYPLRPKFHQFEWSWAFHITGQSMDIASVGEAIIARIYSVNQHARILRVTAIREDKAIRAITDAIHGIIEFDTGPSTQVQRYIHINSWIADQFVNSNTWWLQMILNTGIDAVIEKAAVGGLGNYAPEFVNEIVRALFASRGIYIQGDDDMKITRIITSLISAGGIQKAFPEFQG